jgi:hypothetical protein
LRVEPKMQVGPGTDGIQKLLAAETEEEEEEDLHHQAWL